ncbi:hypothetical protein [Alteribacillus sp. YIM 98480]|uniref:phage tail protein n=1 Tax=Alteribacillus sp. YIM 98480 TaxID=2606599 RepID=UPI00131B8781|nr:hypothetical protein [Alteribacillus sp. YIM 98480]
MATLSEMSVKIGAETSGFEKGMQNVSKKMDSVGKGMKNVGGTMTKWVSGPIAGATAGLGALVTKTAQAGDAAAKNAQKVGVGTEAYQEYEYALGQAGLSQQDTEKTLGRLNTRIGEARAGNEKYSDALKRSGVNMKALKDGTLSTDDAMMQAVEGISQMSNEQDRAQAATDLFGKKLGRELMPAINAGAESLQNGRDKAQEFGHVIGEDAAKKSEEFNDKMEDLGTRMKGLGQQIGAQLIPVLMDQLIPAFEDNILPIFEKVGNKILEMVEWFANLSPSMQGVVAGGTALVAALGPMLVVFGQIVSSISSLTPLFSALGAVIGTVSAPVLAVVAAVAALSAGLVYLWNTNDDFRDAVISAWEKIKDTAVQIWENYIKNTLLSLWGTLKSEGKALWSTLQDFTESATEAISNIIEWFSGQAQDIWDRWGSNLMSIAESTWSTIETVIDSAIQVISNIIQLSLNLIRGDWESSWENIKSIGQAVWNALSSIIENGINTSKKFLEIGLDAATSIWESSWKSVSSYLSKIWKKITSVVQNSIGNVKKRVDSGMNQAKEFAATALNNLFSVFRDILGNIWRTVKQKFGNDIVTAVSNGMTNVKRTAERLWSQVQSFFERINLFSIGADIIRGLADGISSMAGAVMDKARNIASNVKDTISGALDIRSPSRVMRNEVGNQVGAGLVLGMDDMQRDIEKSAQNMADAAVPSVNNDVSNLPASGSQAVSISFRGMFEGANLSVRDEYDIEAISVGLGNQVAHQMRLGGVKG